MLIYRFTGVGCEHDGGAAHGAGSWTTDGAIRARGEHYPGCIHVGKHYEQGEQTPGSRSGTEMGAGPRVGVVQHIQVCGAADGTEHGVRAWGAADSGEHALAWTYLHQVSGCDVAVQVFDGGWRRMTAAYLDKEPQLYDKWSGLNPLGRLGRPDEMRGVVAWLASDASSFCTGSECVFFFVLRRDADSGAAFW